MKAHKHASTHIYTELRPTVAGRESKGKEMKQGELRGGERERKGEAECDKANEGEPEL